MNFRSVVIVTIIACLSSCGDSSSPTENNGTSSSQPAKAGLIMKSAPQDSMAVKAMKDSVQDGDEVIVHGRIREFVEGFAGFTLVDEKMRHCDERDDDNCKTPWDYCCEDSTEMVNHSVTVEVHKDGRISKSNLSGLGGMDRLKDIVVRGKVKKSADGNVIVIASGIFVRP